MSGYEVEHNIQAEKKEESGQRRHLPDLDSFFSSLDQVDTTGTRQPQNTHSVPIPGDVSTTFRLLADAYTVMLRDNGTAGADTPTTGSEGLLAQLVETLRDSAEHPPRELQGVPDSFLDDLERVPKKNLRESDSCPICSEPFLADKYPLVVRLPCHKDHLFDYECIRPWLKLNPTCPLDRQTLWKKKETPPPPADDSDEGEWDDMYA